MAGYIAMGLVLVFFVFSLFVKKIESWIGMPFAYLALAIFFLVNAIYSKELLYGKGVFFIIALILAVKSYRYTKAAK